MNQLFGSASFTPAFYTGEIESVKNLEGLDGSPLPCRLSPHPRQKVTVTPGLTSPPAGSLRFPPLQRVLQVRVHAWVPPVGVKRGLSGFAGGQRSSWRQGVTPRFDAGTGCSRSTLLACSRPAAPERGPSSPSNTPATCGALYSAPRNKMRSFTPGQSGTRPLSAPERRGSRSSDPASTAAAGPAELSAARMAMSRVKARRSAESAVLMRHILRNKEEMEYDALSPAPRSSSSIAGSPAGALFSPALDASPFPAPRSDEVSRGTPSIQTASPAIASVYFTKCFHLSFVMAVPCSPKPTPQTAQDGAN